MVLEQRKLKRLLQEGYDLDFVSGVQPQGNLDFTKSDSFWLQGDGVHTSQYVVDYPTTGLGYHWQSDIMNQPGTRAFLMIHTKNPSEAQSQASSAIEEKHTRIGHNQKLATNQKEADEARALLRMEQKTRETNESVREFAIKLFFAENTEQELNDTISSVKNGTPKFKMTTLLGELDIEYGSVFVPPHRQKDLPNHRNMHPILIGDLAGGYFFNHTSLSDPYGFYAGFTSTGGAINFDMLQYDENRTRPIMLVAGSPRMHQRKFVLRNIDNLYSRGHKIINIDLDGTFKNQTKQQYGRIINFSGNLNRINVMQVDASVTTEDGLAIDENKSFTRHVSKIRGFVSAFNPDLSKGDLSTLDDLVSTYYTEALNLFDPNASLRGEKSYITTLNADEYPKLSDFAAFVAQRARGLASGSLQAKDESESEQTTNIARALRNIVNSYGSLFDAHTEVEDLSDEQVITFDLSDVSDDDIILNMQLFLILSMASAYITNNGKLQSASHYKERNQRLGSFSHYFVNISAAQVILQPQFTETIVYLSKIADSMANNYAGMTLILSSLEGLLGTGQLSSNDTYGKAVKRIFGLTQYRVFAKLPENSVELLAANLQQSMTKNELAILPELTQGQLFLNIDGFDNFIFRQELSKFENERYFGID